jgi:hypothetical protein
MKLKYTAGNILNEEYGGDVEVIQDGKITGQWRWGTTHQTVVRIDGELFGVDYRKQPEEGIQSHGELYRVIPHESVVVSYVRKQNKGDPQ